MMFYLKLALRNLRTNKRAYFPFLISMLFLVAINTLTQVIIKNPGMQKLPDATSAMMMFDAGSVIIIIFSVIFSLYTNSFLLKQRKKEFGLYSVLGLGKRELYQLMMWETWLSFLFVVVSGIFIGTVLAKFAFLVLRKMMQVHTAFIFELPLSVVGNVLGIFAVIFLLLFLINCGQIARTNPIELLHGAKRGEKMPKTNWPVTILGLLLLGTGYYLAVTIESPLAAFSKFFVAVVLVVLGTYCLFTTGSIALLKLLKKRPAFYYQTDHFINVSSMIYRMKQNAAGLASICVLSTMVLVTVATTASLFFGQKDLLATRFTHDIAITTKKNPTALKQTALSFARQAGVQPHHLFTLKMSDSLLFEKTATGFDVSNRLNNDLTKLNRATMFYLLDQKEYQRISHDKTPLAQQEVMLLTLDGKVAGNQLHLANEEFTIKKRIKQLPGFKAGEGISAGYVVVMNDWSTIQNLLNKWYQTKETAEYRQPQYVINFDFNGKTLSSRVNFAKQLQNKLAAIYGPNHQAYQFDSKDEFAQSSQTFTGGFFFLGIIFGLTFTLATALIIYYKQISEGMDDQERFNILQKVGLSHQEVKKVIHSQVLLVFAFPIIVAVIHLAFAFPLIKKLLLLFGLANGNLLLLTTVAVVVIFALLYFIVYQLTAKSYYQIVER